jgi:hypothetical protein
MTLGTHPSALNVNRWGVRETIVGIITVNIPILRPIVSRSFWRRSPRSSSPRRRQQQKQDARNRNDGLITFGSSGRGDRKGGRSGTTTTGTTITMRSNGRSGNFGPYEMTSTVSDNENDGEATAGNGGDGNGGGNNAGVGVGHQRGLGSTGSQEMIIDMSALRRSASHDGAQSPTSPASPISIPPPVLTQHQNKQQPHPPPNGQSHKHPSSAGHSEAGSIHSHSNGNGTSGVVVHTMYHVTREENPNPDERWTRQGGGVTEAVAYRGSDAV